MKMNGLTPRASRCGVRVPGACLGALLVLIVVSLVGCNVVLVAVTGPGTVVAGKSFEVVVTGQQLTNQSGKAAAVLQLPSGFTLEEAWATTETPLTVNDPALLAVYTAEPGHTVVGLSGSLSFPGSTPVSAVFRVRAPDFPATATLKASVAGQVGGAWVAQDPSGGGDFANHTDAGARITVGVTCPGLSAAPPWADLSHGLPAGAAHVSGRDLEVGDVDGDGRQDVVAVAYDASQSTASIVVRRNTGAGFAPLAAPTSPGWMTGPADVALGDYDGDGHLDVADDTGRVFYGDGGLSWTESTFASTRFVRVESGDLDADGNDDILALEYVNIGFGSTRPRFFFGGAGLAELSIGLPAMDGGPIAAILDTPVGAPARFVRWARREPAKAALLVLLLLGGPLVAAYSAYSIPRVRAQLEEERIARIDRWIADGYAFRTDRREAEAARVFREILAEDPTCVEALAGLLVSTRTAAGRLEILDRHASLVRRNPAFGYIEVRALHDRGLTDEADALEATLPEPVTAVDWFLVGTARLRFASSSPPPSRPEYAEAHVEDFAAFPFETCSIPRRTNTARSRSESSSKASSSARWISLRSARPIAAEGSHGSSSTALPSEWTGLPARCLFSASR